MWDMIRGFVGLDTKFATRPSTDVATVELAQQVSAVVQQLHVQGNVLKKLTETQTQHTEYLEESIKTMNGAVTHANARTERMETKYQAAWAHGVEGYIEKCGRERVEAQRKAQPEGEDAFWHDVLLSRCRELEKRVEVLEGALSNTVQELLKDIMADLKTRETQEETKEA